VTSPALFIQKLGDAAAGPRLPLVLPC